LTALVVGAALGLLAAVALWVAARELFSGPLFIRHNYRGASVPVGVGVLLAIAAVVVEALVTAAEALHHELATDRAGRAAVVLVALGFGLLGLLDDLAATGDDRGFTGHLRAMAGGRLTTGGIKLLGGGLVAVVAAGAAGPPSLGRLLLDSLVIALAANVANLFDRAPGRVIKVGLLAAVPVFALASATDRTQLTGVAVVVGASLGLLLFDLREQLMLGDAGSNVIGAAMAVGFTRTTGTTAHGVALAVLVGLNLASERVSFSRVIEAVAPLRALDHLGRRGDRGTS